MRNDLLPEDGTEYPDLVLKHSGLRLQFGDCVDLHSLNTPWRHPPLAKQTDTAPTTMQPVGEPLH